MMRECSQQDPKKKAICDTMYYVQIDFMIKID